MSGRNIDKLLSLLAALYPDSDPPFADHNKLYSIIDATKSGDIPWQSFSVTYNGQMAVGDDVPPWKTTHYDVWFRDPLQVMENQISNTNFAG